MNREDLPPAANPELVPKSSEQSFPNSNSAAAAARNGAADLSASYLVSKLPDQERSETVENTAAVGSVSVSNGPVDPISSGVADNLVTPAGAVSAESIPAVREQPPTAPCEPHSDSFADLLAPGGQRNGRSRSRRRERGLPSSNDERPFFEEEPDFVQSVGSRTCDNLSLHQLIARSQPRDGSSDDDDPDFQPATSEGEDPDSSGGSPSGSSEEEAVVELSTPEVDTSTEGGTGDAVPSEGDESSSSPDRVNRKRRVTRLPSAWPSEEPEDASDSRGNLVKRPRLVELRLQSVDGCESANSNSASKESQEEEKEVVGLVSQTDKMAITRISGEGGEDSTPETREGEDSTDSRKVDRRENSNTTGGGDDTNLEQNSGGGPADGIAEVRADGLEDVTQSEENVSRVTQCTSDESPADGEESDFPGSDGNNEARRKRPSLPKSSGATGGASGAASYLETELRYADFHGLPKAHPLHEIDFFFPFDEGQPETLHSPEKVLFGVFRFRILVFPHGTRSAKKKLPSVFVEALEPIGHKGLEWVFLRAAYSIMVINRFDWRKSKIQVDSHSFCAKDADRGWHDMLNQEEWQRGGWVGPMPQGGQGILLRAGVYLRHGEIIRRPIGFSSSRSETGFVGLKNHGATCYMNSLLQALYHVGRFRKAVYQLSYVTDQQQQLDETTQLQQPTPSTDAELAKAMSSHSDDDKLAKLPVSTALQNLFYTMSKSEDACSCEELIRSFGWDDADAFTQHDAQELNRLLCDKLEEQMQGTPSQGCIEELFQGEMEMYIKCTDVQYESKRTETFHDIQLDVSGVKSLRDSLKQYIETEVLEGENSYAAEGHGKQRAIKGIRFLKFPPVIQFHLKRFQFDLGRMDMVKINDGFSFPRKINLSEFVPGSGEYVLHAVVVHLGDVNSGHYYTFVWNGERNRWLRFDDEKVTFISEFAAIDDNYGGADMTCHEYLKDWRMHEEVVEEYPDLLSEEPVEIANERLSKRCRVSLGNNKLSSAYMLYYVKESMAKELLEPPVPETVNRGMALRIEREMASVRRKHEIRSAIANVVVVKVLTEDSLIGFKGLWNSSCDFPAERTLRKERFTTIEALYEEITKMNFAEVPKNSSVARVGLWVLDCTASGEIQLVPVDFYDNSNKRQRKLGTLDSLTWCFHETGNKCEPVLNLVVHWLEEFQRAPRDFEEMYRLQQESRLFAIKFFDPFVAGDDDSPHDIYFSGFGELHNKLDKDFLEDRVLDAILKLRKRGKIGLHHPDASVIPQIEKSFANSSRVFKLWEYAHEDRGTIFPLTPKLIREQFTPEPNNYEVFGALIVSWKFETPSEMEILDARRVSEAIGTGETADSYVEDTSAKPGTSIVIYDASALSEGAVAATEEGTPFNDKAVPKSASVPVMPSSAVDTPSNAALRAHNGEKAVASATGEFASEESVAFWGLPTKLWAPLFHFPPKMPVFYASDPRQWILGKYVQGKQTVLLKLYDVMQTLSSWETSTGQLIGEVGDIGACIRTNFGSSNSLTSQTSVNSMTQTDVTTGDSKRGADVQQLPTSDSTCDLATAEKSAAPANEHLNDTFTPPGTAKPIKIVKLEVDMRWPFLMAFKYIAWHLGVDHRYLWIQPIPQDFGNVKSDKIFSLYQQPQAVALSGYSESAVVPRLKQAFDVFQSINAPRSGFWQLYGAKPPSADAGPPIGPSPSPGSVPTAPKIPCLTISLLPREASTLHPSSTKRPVVVRLFNRSVEVVGALLLDVSNDSTVADLIEKAKPQIAPEQAARGLEDVEEYRIVRTLQENFNVLRPNQLVVEVLQQGGGGANPFTCWLRMEPVPDQADGSKLENAKAVQVHHAASDSHGYSAFYDNLSTGHPFEVYVQPGELLAIVKKRIESKLNLSASDFGRWRFYLFDFVSKVKSFLRDDAPLPEALTSTDSLGELKMCLLAEHPASNRRASRRNFALHIRG